MTKAKIENSTELNSITDVTLRNNVKNFTIDILEQWNSFPKSDEMKAFNNQINTFKSTEILSDPFLNLTQQLLHKSKNLVKYDVATTYSSVSNNQTQAYINWFRKQMKDHVTEGYLLPNFTIAANSIISNAPFYKRFLNPLHKGDIKKTNY